MLRRFAVFFALLAVTGCSGEPDPPTHGEVDSGVDAAMPTDASAPDAGTDAATTDMRPDEGPDLGPALDVVARGAFAVGVRTVQLEDASRSRILDVEVWYPATTPGAGDVLDFETEPNRATYADLLQAAPDCPSRATASSRDADVAPGGPWPVIAFSHCHACTRYSSFTIAEHLASWGYVVIAPDHEENTLYDELAGTGAALGTAFLQTRAADARFVLTELLDGRVASDLTLDVDRVGVMGHSFGSVTAGLVAQEDPRIKAAVGIAAPMDNPLLPGVRMAELDEPVMFLVAVEDNSIQEIGNRLIRDNFDKAITPAFKVEVADAGHWSFSDLAGLVEMFAPGCGEDNRQTGPEDFTYLNPATGRSIGAAYATAFFEWTLRENPEAYAFLLSDSPWPEVAVDSRQP